MHSDNPSRPIFLSPTGASSSSRRRPRPGSAKCAGSTPTPSLPSPAITIRRELIWPWPHCRRYLSTMTRHIVESAGLSADKRGMSLFHKIRRTCISYCAAVSPALAETASRARRSANDEQLHRSADRQVAVRRGRSAAAKMDAASGRLHGMRSECLHNSSRCVFRRADRWTVLPSLRRESPRVAY